MSIEDEVLDFVYSLQRMYLEQRDVEHVLAAINEHTSLIGTGRQEICKSFTEATHALLSDKAEYESGFVVTDCWYETQVLSPEICLVYGEFWAQAAETTTDVAELHHRVSATCIKSPDGIKLIHLHMSSPDDDQEKGEYFVKRRTREDNRTLRLVVAQTAKDLSQRNRELEILTGNIPGGVHQCANDPELTLLSMSGGFLSLFGYTRADITRMFDERYMNMIYAADRDVLRSALGEQLSCGNAVELEYRVVCKSGALIWVLDRGSLVRAEDGSQSFFCMMMDITKRKEDQEALRLTLERHKVIMNQATDIIFEWDILQDTLDYSSNWEKKFGYAPVGMHISRHIPQSGNVHSDDMPVFMELMGAVAAGAPYAEAEFRIRDITSAYTWCRIRATTQFDCSKRPIKAVGVIVDIDAEKNQKNLLIEEAQHDSLTKLYNKNTVKAKVDCILSDQSSESLHALMIVDVDNFKTVNDRFGHLCGDALLSNMAQALKKLFRASDVIGRIGGDEFLVFMNNIGSPPIAAAKAQEVVHIFQTLPVEMNALLSCSVGISFYPKDATDYMELCRCADSALYQVKNNGKIGFSCYEENMREGVPYTLMRTAINTKMDIEENWLNQELVQYAFRMLYNAVDTKTAVNQIIKMVGQTYEVSRVYVFETSEDGQYCSNTFEWCNEGICPEREHLQNLSFEDDLKGFFDLFDDSGVFYCQDVKMLNSTLSAMLEAQGVVSILQCFVQDDGCLKGYVGFDECRRNRYWTKDQVRSLTLIAKVLSTFLLKLRLKEQVARLQDQKNM